MFENIPHLLQRVAGISETQTPSRSPVHVQSNEARHDNEPAGAFAGGQEGAASVRASFAGFLPLPASADCLIRLVTQLESV
jgi:hypothetical protein